jgi:hypothetical protein
MPVNADQKAETPTIPWRASVRVTVDTPQVAAWLRRALRDYDVECEGLELEIRRVDPSVDDGILLILQTIARALQHAGAAPITVAFEGRPYTVQPSAA